jgi:hypothetical protein
MLVCPDVVADHQTSHRLDEPDATMLYGEYSAFAVTADTVDLSHDSGRYSK